MIARTLAGPGFWHGEFPVEVSEENGFVYGFANGISAQAKIPDGRDKVANYRAATDAVMRALGFVTHGERRAGGLFSVEDFYGAPLVEAAEEAALEVGSVSELHVPMKSLGMWSRLYVPFAKWNEDGTFTVPILGKRVALRGDESLKRGYFRIVR